MVLKLLSTLKKEPNGVFGKEGLILNGEFFYPNNAFVGTVWACAISKEELAHNLTYDCNTELLYNIRNKIKDIKFELSKTQGVALDIKIDIDKSSFIYDDCLQFKFTITQCESDCS